MFEIVYFFINILLFCCVGSETLDYFEMEYKLKKKQTKATRKLVHMKEKVTVATICKMEEDERALVMDT